MTPWNVKWNVKCIKEVAGEKEKRLIEGKNSGLHKLAV